MLVRFIVRSSSLRLLTLPASKLQHWDHHHHFHSNLPPQNRNVTSLLRSFSSGNGKGHDDPWKLSRETEAKFDSIFNQDPGAGDGGDSRDSAPEDSWLKEGEVGVGGDGDGWVTAEGYKQWSLASEENAGDDLFHIDETRTAEDKGIEEKEMLEKRIEKERLEREEKELTAVLQGPNRAFGDLIAASGITDAMLDSLIALKDFEGIEGLPPLSEIEDIRYEKNTRKSSRAEIERLKQEEIAKARVRQVDDKGRAYGTGRRKCSIARVWVQPGDGKFVVNDKEFDVYFPMLDHRAALLRPFSETKTLGLWDVTCTVKGGGVSGQVGAIRLGISRALQNWEPGLRPALRAAGFLTRDPRVVERKKPGKAKARKSFQWVKR